MMMESGALENQIYIGHRKAVGTNVCYCSWCRLRRLHSTNLLSTNHGTNVDNKVR